MNPTPCGRTAPPVQRASPATPLYLPVTDAAPSASYQLPSPVDHLPATQQPASLPAPQGQEQEQAGSSSCGSCSNNSAASSANPPAPQGPCFKASLWARPETNDGLPAGPSDHAALVSQQQQMQMQQHWERDASSLGCQRQQDAGALEERRLADYAALEQQAGHHQAALEELRRRDTALLAMHLNRDACELGRQRARDEARLRAWLEADVEALGQQGRRHLALLAEMNNKNSAVTRRPSSPPQSVPPPCLPVEMAVSALAPLAPAAQPPGVSSRGATDRLALLPQLSREARTQGISPASAKVHAPCMAPGIAATDMTSPRDSYATRDQGTMIMAMP
jgi:hypothetical protein